jgi:Flp pilus assembly protein TadG
VTADRRRADDGSLTVELVVLTPVVFLFALMVLVFGRVADAHQQVAEAARAGAQAAAVAPSAGQAGGLAESDADAGLIDRNDLCTSAQVTTDTQAFVPGGSVRVTVVCRVNLSDLSVPGIPGSTSVQATAVAPIDPYRAVG